MDIRYNISGSIPHLPGSHPIQLASKIVKCWGVALGCHLTNQQALS